MKGFIIVLLCFVVASFATKIDILKENNSTGIYNKILKLQYEIEQLKAENEQLRSEKRLNVNIDKYLDNTMKTVQFWMVKNGLDPYETPNVDKSFRVKVGWVTFHGEFELTNGWMQGLSSVERVGQATMNYEAELLNLRLPIGLETVLINYDYLAKIMNLGPKGGVEGKIKNLQLLIDISIDTSNFEFILQGFKIVDAGKISIKFSGNSLVDWLANTLTGISTRIMHDLAIKVLQTKVRSLLEEAIDQLNREIHPQLGY